MATIRKRGKGWQAIVRKLGHQHAKTFPTKNEAEAWATQIEAKIIRRELPTVHNQTLGDLIDLFEKDRDRSPTYMASVKRWRVAFGHLPLRKLDKHTLLAYCKPKMASVKGATIHRELTTLRSILNHARDLHDIDVDDPVCPVLKALANNHAMNPAERNRTATDRELHRLIGHFEQRGDALAAITKVSMGSAMRLGEICGLRWEDLDADRRTILVRERKDPSRKNNHMSVPLRAEPITGYDGLEAILGLSRHYDGPIFEERSNPCSKRWRYACAELGIDDLHFHDLRHSCLTRAAAYWNGDLAKLRVLSGHRSFKHLARYVNLTAESVAFG